MTSSYHQSEIQLTKNTPYLSLPDVYCKGFGEHWACYDSTVLYPFKYSEHVICPYCNINRCPFFNVQQSQINGKIMDNSKSHNFCYLCLETTEDITPNNAHHFMTRDHFVNAPSQWETTLHCNVVSHWLGAFIKWSVHDIMSYKYRMSYLLLRNQASWVHVSLP